MDEVDAACVFTNFMSTLVNYNSKKNFEVQRGLRQGTDFLPFFFLSTQSRVSRASAKSSDK